MEGYLEITAQYFENYADDLTQDGWKSKGEERFTIELDDMTLMHTPREKVMVIVSRILEKRSNEKSHWVYKSHDVRFFTPTEIPTNEYYEALRELEAEASA